MIFFAQERPTRTFWPSAVTACQMFVANLWLHEKHFINLSLPRRLILGSSLPCRENALAIFLPGLLDRCDNLVERRHLAVANEFLGQNLPSGFGQTSNVFSRVKLLKFRHVSS